MLEHLSFTNFKAWKEAEISFGKITGLFGTNSSGKTSLLQFLLLLKQTKDAADRGLSLDLGGPYLNLGSYRDFIHGHDENAQLNWSLVWNEQAPITLIDPSAKRTQIFERGNRVAISSSIDQIRGAPRARTLEYRLGNHAFRLIPKPSDQTNYSLHSTGGFKFKRFAGRVWQIPGPVKSYGFPDQVLTYFQNAGFLSQLVAGFEGQMDQIFHLGPLREPPKREYLWNRSRPSDVGTRGNLAIEAILAATERGEKRNRATKARLLPFQGIIAYWLKEMGLVDSFTVRELKEGSGVFQAYVRVRSDAPEVLLTEVGFGISQVLPVLTLLYYVPEGSTVILEQPEIHLHPLAQAGLADVILAVALHRNVQVIVESHSEHFLLRLQRRIAEKEASPTDVKLYFCQGEKGVSELVSLQLDLLGTINNWPRDFFGDAFGETAAAQAARLKQRSEAA